MISPLFSGAVETATHLAPLRDKLFFQCGPRLPLRSCCILLPLPLSHSLSLWVPASAFKTTGLHKVNVERGAILLTTSFIILILLTYEYHFAVDVDCGDFAISLHVIMSLTLSGVDF